MPKKESEQNKPEASTSASTLGMNINELNYDCFSHILSMIPFNELIEKRLVCKLWCETIETFITNKRHFVYTNDINSSKKNAITDHTDGHSNGQSEGEEDNKYFFKYHNRLRALLDLEQFDNCLKMMPNLHSLTMDGVYINDAMLPIMAFRCPKITKLKFINQTETLSLVGLNLLVRKFPLITHLDMPNCQLDDDAVFMIAMNLKNLIHFNFSKDRDKSSRLSRFTGCTLKYLGPRIDSLHIGEPIYWDQQLVKSIVTSNARNISVLSIHLVKLKDLKDICDSMIQLKEFYLSFNGGDINSFERNIGCVRYISKLINLEILVIIDDGRHHCNGINGCHSLYTAPALSEIVQKCTKLRCLNLLDYDNWHSKVPMVDDVLRDIKVHCPNLSTFGISAGLFELRKESYSLIIDMNLKKLNLQGDLELQQMNTGSGRNGRKNNLNDQVIIKLCKSNNILTCLMVSNSNLITNESLEACFEMARRRPKEKFFFAFLSTAITRPPNQSIPPNVSLDIHQPEFNLAFEDILDVSTDSDDDDVNIEFSDSEDSDHSLHSYFSDDNSVMDIMESDSELE